MKNMSSFKLPSSRKAEEKSGEKSSLKDRAVKATSQRELNDYKFTDDHEVVISSKKPRIKPTGLHLFISQAMDNILLKHRELDLSDMIGDEYEDQIEELDKMENRLGRMRTDLAAAEAASEDGLVPNPFYRTAEEQERMPATPLLKKDLTIIGGERSVARIAELLKQLEMTVKLEKKKGGIYAYSMKQLTEQGRPSADLKQEIEEMLPILSPVGREYVYQKFAELYRGYKPTEAEKEEGKLYGKSIQLLPEQRAIESLRPFPFAPTPTEAQLEDTQKELQSTQVEPRTGDTLVELTEEDFLSPEEIKRELKQEIQSLIWKMIRAQALKVGLEGAHGLALQQTKKSNANSPSVQALAQEIKEKAKSLTPTEQMEIQNQIRQIIGNRSADNLAA